MKDISKKVWDRELKRRKERKLKRTLDQTAKGRSLWFTRKHGKFVSQLMMMGYTHKEALLKASNIYMFVKG